LTALEAFGSHLVVLSSPGVLCRVDVATGRVCAERRVGRFFTHLRLGAELVLFFRRRVGDASRVSVEGYSPDRLDHLWFATLPRANVYDAVATERCVLVSARGARRPGPEAADVAAVSYLREVLAIDRRSGAVLGSLDLSPYHPYTLTSFVSWPRHLLGTVHSVVEKVAGQRLVAFGTKRGAPPIAAGKGDELLQALRQGRISARGRVALARKHAARGAFEEALDVLDRAVPDEKLSNVDYLRLGDAMAVVRRAAAPWRLEKMVYPLDLAMPRPIVLDGFRDFGVSEVRNSKQLDRWGGPDDLSAHVYLAYTHTALSVYVKARDDKHHPGAREPGDHLELIIARWQMARRQWVDGDIRFGLAARQKPELWFWLARAPEDTRAAIRCDARRHEARKLTTYQLLIPWRVLERFVPNRGARLDFAIAVHDDDGRGPKGAMRWGCFQPRLAGRLRLR